MSLGFIFLILSFCLMCLTAKYSADRHKPKTQHGNGEKQKEIRTKKEKRVSNESIASFTRERKRRKKKKKKVGEKERCRFCFGLAHSWTPLYLSLFKVYLSHLDITSPHGFILHVDYNFLSLWFVLICYMYSCCFSCSCYCYFNLTWKSIALRNHDTHL